MRTVAGAASSRPAPCWAFGTAASTPLTATAGLHFLSLLYRRQHNGHGQVANPPRLLDYALEGTASFHPRNNPARKVLWGPMSQMDSRGWGLSGFTHNQTCELSLNPEGHVGVTPRDLPEVGGGGRSG